MIKTILNTLHDSIACLTFVGLGYISAFVFFFPFFTHFSNWHCLLSFPLLCFFGLAGLWFNSRGQNKSK